MPVSNVRPGMKGYGLTVFRGTKPERFEVEVIDILHKFRADQDLILVRTKHPLLEHAKAVAGMSGSPIYLEGKLVGAYAYGWPFGKDPIVGVTPIQNMMAELGRRPSKAAAQRASTKSSTRKGGGTKKQQTFREKLQQDKLRDQQNKLWNQRNNPSPFASLRNSTVMRKRTKQLPSNGIVPLATPLLVGGLSPQALRKLRAELADFGVVPLEAGGSARKPNTSASDLRYVPGGALGIQLIGGDLAATAIGTITHVHKGKVLAFGHPMMNLGELSLPATHAKVLHILASENRSFKLAEAIGIEGALVQDRLPAIVVDPKQKAARIPVELTLENFPGARKKHWAMWVADHPLLTPALAYTAVASAADAVASELLEATLSTESEIELCTGKKMELKDKLFLPGSASAAEAIATLRVFGLLGLIRSNAFKDCPAKRIRISVRAVPKAAWNLVRIGVPTTRVDPGARIPIDLHFESFRGNSVRKRKYFTIPERAAGQEIELRVEPGRQAQSDRPIPENFDDLLRSIKDQHQSDELVLSLDMQTRGFEMRGHVLPDLPASALDALSPRGGNFPRNLTSALQKQVLKIEHVVSGQSRMKLQVRRKPKHRKHHFGNSN